MTVTLAWGKIIFSAVFLTKINSIYFIFLFYSFLIYFILYIFVTFSCSIFCFYHILFFLHVRFRICHSFLLHLLFLQFFPSWSGQYVILDVEFSLEACETAQIKLKEMGYLSIFSLLKHENKLSVMHCNVQRNEQAGDTTVIRSKEELFFQVSYIFHILHLIFIFHRIFLREDFYWFLFSEGNLMKNCCNNDDLIFFDRHTQYWYKLCDILVFDLVTYFMTNTLSRFLRSDFARSLPGPFLVRQIWIATNTSLKDFGW